MEKATTKEAHIRIVTRAEMILRQQRVVYVSHLRYNHSYKISFRNRSERYGQHF